MDQVLRLEFGDAGEDMKMAMTFLTAAVLYEIWILRKNATRVRLPLVRAQLEARLAILRTTRHSKIANDIAVIITDF